MKRHALMVAGCTAALLSGCPDDDGPGGDAVDAGVGTGDTGESVCAAICDQAEAHGLLCGASRLGFSGKECRRACSTGDLHSSEQAALLAEVEGADCRDLVELLPDALLLPCRCAPAPDAFDALVAGPLAACAGCHGETLDPKLEYAAVVAHVNRYDVDASRLLCKAVGCNEHVGGAVWAGPGSCEYRTVRAWIGDAAGPGEGCEPMAVEADCIVCGDAPAEGEGEGEGEVDAADLARFEAEVEPGLLGDCESCHAGGVGGYTLAGADTPEAHLANYEASLQRVDRDGDDPAASVLLQRSLGVSHPVSPWNPEACGYRLTLAWIARDDPPADCVEGTQ